MGRRGKKRVFDEGSVRNSEKSETLQNGDSQDHQDMSSFANEADVDISEGLVGQQHEIRVEEDGA